MSYNSCICIFFILFQLAYSVRLDLQIEAYSGYSYWSALKKDNYGYFLSSYGIVKMDLPNYAVVANANFSESAGLYGGFLYGNFVYQVIFLETCFVYL